MGEFKLLGLSCPDCTRELERQIHQLPYGQTAKLSYALGKLQVDDRIDLQKVRSILDSDGVQLMPATQSATTEHHHDEHAGFRRLPWKFVLTISTVLYILALLLEGVVLGPYAIIFYVVAMALSGYQTFRKGLHNLVRLKFTIDTLMTVALIGAVAIGEWKEGTLVAILFGLNEYLEGIGMEKARRSVETLLNVAPKEAIVIREGKETVVPIETLTSGDIVIVRAGDRIPSDGVVVDGKSSVSEAAITGESLPVDKRVGDFVFGGSVNHEGVLTVEIKKPYEDSALAKILHLVEEAQETKTPTELFINRFAKYYTPFIMFIAALVITVPPLLLGHAWEPWIYQGLAVLIVGCPCALILSSPIANIAGITRNARHGILIKGSVFLEQLGRVKTIAFDKTGTLTKGTPHVEKVVVYDEKRLYPIALAIEKSSSHPVAQAIVREIEKKQTDMERLEPETIETVAGKGIIATIDGHTYTVGNEQSVTHVELPEQITHDIQRLKQEGLTLVIVADEISVLGMFGIADEIREESREVVQALHRQGIEKTVMLTGDHDRAAKKVAEAVGVSAYVSQLLPEQKVDHIKTLAKDGHVAMIGDGINDAPALAFADLGIAMGKGTDSAIETADVVLMHDHLGKLPNAIALAKRVNRIVKFNISLALGLKLFALLLTIPGLLTLWIAILSDMGATVAVTLISLAVLWEPKKSYKR